MSDHCKIPSYTIDSEHSNILQNRNDQKFRLRGYGIGQVIGPCTAASDRGDNEARMY